MKITYEQLEFSTRQVIQELTGDVYDYGGSTENENNTRILTLGEISGVLKLRDRLVEVLDTK